VGKRRRVSQVRLLLDTHTFLYAINFWERLGSNARGALTDTQNERWVSAITLAEIGIKVAIGKLPLPKHPDYYLRHLEALRAEILPVGVQHSLKLLDLPMHHRDPFDRLLIAQAKTEELTIVTQDRAFAAYGVATLW